MDKCINIAMIGDHCADTLELSLLSIKDIAKQIIFVWGMEDEKVPKIIEEFSNKYKLPFIFIGKKWDKEDKMQNGRQRQIYLDYLIKNCYGEFALVMDPDEVLEDQNQIVKFLEKNKDRKHQFYSPRMRHLIYNLATEDATREKHYVPRRLLKVDYRLFYPAAEHPVLMSLVQNEENYVDEVMIWHLGHCKNMFDVKNKFEGHIKKSEMHTKKFLIQWYMDHIFGTYLTSKFSPLELPKVLRDYFKLGEFGIEDILYFKDRIRMEEKHYIDVIDWIAYFKPNTVYDVGCGAGQRTAILNRAGIDCIGIDKSQFIIDAIKEINPHLKDRLKCIDINDFEGEKRDLIIAYDILEHIEYTDIDKVLINIKKLGDWFLFSIPFLNDPNLEADKTHIIKETREWWENKLKEHEFIIKETPKWFNAKQQIIIAR